MAMVRKITAKVVCGKPDKKEIINSEGEPLWLMAVYGRVTRAVEGETDYGKFLKFKGTFEAVNLATGEEFKSMNLILPPIAEELVEEALAGEGVTTVDFALNVGVRRDDDSIAGYQWVAESVRASDAGDPLSNLRQELMDMKVIPLLGSPEEVEKPVREKPPTKTTKTTAARR